jgi:hypothetical protein
MVCRVSTVVDSVLRSHGVYAPVITTNLFGENGMALMPLTCASIKIRRMLPAPSENLSRPRKQSGRRLETRCLGCELAVLDQGKSRNPLDAELRGNVRFFIGVHLDENGFTSAFRSGLCETRAAKGSAPLMTTGSVMRGSVSLHVPQRPCLSRFV